MESEKCSICCEDFKYRVVVNFCRHTFCEACLLNWISVKVNKHKRPSCPICRRRIWEYKRVRNPGLFAYRRFKLESTKRIG
ncbi:hypothetical protein M758_2G053500 [Ceratodon purpureus]|nr:hypothetical protein M758_2G052200 [Ceratodon purpureus]KAG0625418.1 hypothetical protein M758_2G053500 [Ceratodon purpureus]